MAQVLEGGPGGGWPRARGEGAGVKGLAVRLSVMMLLEFIVFGAWFATLGLVLATHGMAAHIGHAYLLSAIAAILSPLCLGAVGDRYMAPRNVLALSHLVGAALLVALPLVIRAGDTGATLAVTFIYMLAFQPTLGLVNAITLDLLRGHQRLFPFVRVFGPLGWVVAGLVVGALGLSASADVFLVAAGASAALGLYALTLPHTAPPARGARFSLGDFIGVKAFVLFRDRSFAVLMLCSLLTSISLGVYNTFASTYLAVLGITNVAGTLALGQASEVVFIVTIPWIMNRIGMKWALLLGMGMWGVRFALFIAAAGHGGASVPWLAVAGVGLHGICNDYFIVIAAMFIARMAPADLAAQAQGWLILMISGFGAALGSAISGQVFGAVVATRPQLGAAAWAPLWLVPTGLAALTCLIWLLFFRPVHDGRKPETPSI
jgi:nucleoside transporter